MITVYHAITGTNVGGAEIVLQRSLSALDREHYANRVLSLLAPGGVAPRIEALGVPVDTLNMARALPGPQNLWRLFKVVGRETPDVIHGWMYHGCVAGTAAWRLKGKRSALIWSIHHSLNDIAQEPKRTRQMIRLLARWSGLPASIIYCSKTARAQHERVGFSPERGVMIPNGIDTAHFRPDPAARGRLAEIVGASPDQFLIAVIGRVDPMKDHSNAIRAAARLKAEGRDFRMMFMGRDAEPSNAELNASIAEAGVGDRIALLGQRDDIPALMPGLDLLLSSSAWGEAFPLVIAEAMAAGVPAVATDLGDSADLIGDTGSIVPPRDADALAAAVAKVMDMDGDARAALGARARRRIEKNFALSAVTRLYEDVYDRVAAR